MVGMAANGPDARSSTNVDTASANTPHGSFVRDSYAVDCARFVAELKQRVAADQPANTEQPHGTG
jgi:hypothetical protein